MKDTNLQKRTPVSELDDAISNVLPSLDRKQIRNIRNNLLKHIASGLNDRYTVSLIKPKSDKEIEIRLLNIIEHESGDNSIVKSLLKKK